LTQGCDGYLAGENEEVARAAGPCCLSEERTRDSRSQENGLGRRRTTLRRDILYNKDVPRKDFVRAAPELGVSTW
jgi:hypothetical protein